MNKLAIASWLLTCLPAHGQEPEAPKTPETVGAFVAHIEKMSDQELWDFMFLRLDEASENLRLTGEYIIPKWNKRFTAEATKREKAQMLPMEEIKKLTSAELEVRLLATKNVPFVARLRRQLERASGFSLEYVEAKIRDEKDAKERRQTIDRLFPPKVAERLRNREAWVGMTAAQLRLSWGLPDDINTTVNSRGRKEQWVYGLGRYAYVEAGKVSALQF